MKIISAKQDDESVKIGLENGDHISLHHDQDCCESVTLEDSDGDIADSVGKRLLRISKRSGDIPQAEKLKKIKSVLRKGEDHYEDESSTWTFIVVETSLETITYRFYGTSNGYYSEDVDIHLYKAGEDHDTCGSYIEEWVSEV